MLLPKLQRATIKMLTRFLRDVAKNLPHPITLCTYFISSAVKKGVPCWRMEQSHTPVNFFGVELHVHYLRRGSTQTGAAMLETLLGLPRTHAERLPESCVSCAKPSGPCVVETLMRQFNCRIVWVRGLFAMSLYSVAGPSITCCNVR